MHLEMVSLKTNESVEKKSYPQSDVSFHLSW